jgi:imidazolonepropionase-like amidohydrolase
VSRLVVADRLWDGGWVAGGGLLVGDGFVTPATPDDVAEAEADGAVERVAGSLVPGFTDSHVHLDLVPAQPVETGGLTRVVDLGANPAHVLAAGAVEVARAGQILTAVGGYPSTRPWAADAMFREVSAGDVDAAVREQAVAGAVALKIALNSDAGPVWPDELLTEVVRVAHAWDLPVVAHAEGTGQARRAASAGVDAFAHAPFTEHLDDDLIAQLAATTTWISTLRIHDPRDRDIAVANVTRFHAAGGRIRYGTDMGNGASSGGVERDELELLTDAGLGFDDLIAALSGDGLLPCWGARATLVTDVGLAGLLAAAPFPRAW